MINYLEELNKKREEQNKEKSEKQTEEIPETSSKLQ